MHFYWFTAYFFRWKLHGIVLLPNCTCTPSFNFHPFCHFYRATACNAANAMHGIAVAILSVCLSDTCIVTKLNDGLWIFW